MQVDWKDHISEDCQTAQKIADKFPKQRWEKTLASFARRVNAMLKGIVK